MLRDLLLVLNMLVCVALIGVVLLQRSEGGAFGTGGPTGLVTARGAGDLLTRTTWVLFTMFLALSLALTLLGGRERSSQAILERLKGTTVNPDLINKTAPSPPPSTPIPTAPAQGAPPTLTLPPIASAPSAPQPANPRPPHTSRHASAPEAVAPATSPPPPKLATPAPLTLPPITAPADKSTPPS
jgi:preprotein translocase subunit SecG